MPPLSSQTRSIAASLNDLLNVVLVPRQIRAQAKQHPQGLQITLNAPQKINQAPAITLIEKALGKLHLSEPLIIQLQARCHGVPDWQTQFNYRPVNVIPREIQPFKPPEITPPLASKLLLNRPVTLEPLPSSPAVTLESLFPPDETTPPHQEKPSEPSRHISDPWESSQPAELSPDANGHHLNLEPEVISLEFAEHPRPEPEVISLEFAEHPRPESEVISLELAEHPRPESEVISLELEDHPNLESEVISLESEDHVNPESEVISLESEDHVNPKSEIISLESEDHPRPEPEVISLELEDHVNPEPEVISLEFAEHPRPEPEVISVELADHPRPALEPLPTPQAPDNLLETALERLEAILAEQFTALDTSESFENLDVLAPLEPIEIAKDLNPDSCPSSECVECVEPEAALAIENETESEEPLKTLATSEDIADPNLPITPPESDPSLTAAEIHHPALKPYSPPGPADVSLTDDLWLDQSDNSSPEPEQFTPNLEPDSLSSDLWLEHPQPDVKFNIESISVVEPIHIPETPVTDLDNSELEISVTSASELIDSVIPADLSRSDLLTTEPGLVSPISEPKPPDTPLPEVLELTPELPEPEITLKSESELKPLESDGSIPEALDLSAPGLDIEPQQNAEPIPTPPPTLETDPDLAPTSETIPTPTDLPAPRFTVPQVESVPRDSEAKVAGMAGVVMGLGFCATGFGSVIGVPLLIGGMGMMGEQQVFRGPCPHCGQALRVALGKLWRFSCPTCQGLVIIKNGRFYAHTADPVNTPLTPPPDQTA